MGLFDKIFKNQQKDKQESPINQEPEHAVIIRFDYGINGLDSLHSLENQLESVIKESQTGEYDGHEIATDYSDGILYMYGPNAEVLFKSVKPVLEKTDFMKGAKAKLRFGPPADNVKEIEVEI